MRMVIQLGCFSTLDWMRPFLFSSNQWMHIGFIQRTRRVENDLKRHMEAEARKKIDIKRKKQVSAAESNVISEGFDSFLFGNIETAASDPKQTRFETVSNSDDDEDLVIRNTSVRLPLKRNLELQCEKSGGSQQYSLEAEELALLEKQLSADKERNCTDFFSNDDEDLRGKSQDIFGRKKRRVLQQKKSLASRPCNLTEEEYTKLDKKLFTLESKYATAFLLKDDDLKIFIAAWKDICQEHSVYEVLKRMMESQWTVSKKGVNRIKRLFTFFSTQPAIGLLNVAVMAMKMGLWDRLYGTFQEISKQEGKKTEIADSSGVMDVGLSREAALVPSFKEENNASVSENGSKCR